MDEWGHTETTTTTYVSSPSRAERIGERPWLGLVAYLPPPQPAGRRVNAGMRLHEEAERVRELGPVNTLGNRNKLGGKAAPSVDKSVCMGRILCMYQGPRPRPRTVPRTGGIFGCSMDLVVAVFWLGYYRQLIYLYTYIQISPLCLVFLR
jgi:hypothetical protein